ncbi:hypothetical protein AAU61_04930 [Desulfocarbo indianensis]|nr:hypothetical protein AAU61_04930 [Desulfocarbo indianensis]
MNKLLSVFLALMGMGLLAMSFPVYDLMLGNAWRQGGLMASVLFLALLLLGGLLLLIVAGYLWRKA